MIDLDSWPRLRQPWRTSCRRDVLQQLRWANDPAAMSDDLLKWADGWLARARENATWLDRQCMDVQAFLGHHLLMCGDAWVTERNGVIVKVECRRCSTTLVGPGTAEAHMEGLRADRVIVDEIATFGDPPERG